MNTGLSITFSAIDKVSMALKNMAKEAHNAYSCFEDLGRKADDAFGACVREANLTDQTLQDFADDIADSFLESFNQAAEGAKLSEGQMRDAYNELPEFFHGVAEGLEAELLGVGESTNETTEEVEELGDAFESTGTKGEQSGQKMENAMSSLESFMAAAGVIATLKGIADAFSDCTKQAEITETAFAKLETIAGSSPMDWLKEDIMELSSATGIAAADLADVAYNAISAGTAVEDSVSMAATASKLATAGFTDTSSALGVLTTATNAYGKAAGSAKKISDSLITVQNLGVTTVAELSANMGKAIATASAYNVSLDNLESSYISVTKAGINTAEGTTYISSMLKELGKDGSDVAEILEEQTGKSFAELMASGSSLADVLNILYESVDKDSTALMNLWGSAEAGKAANAIVSQGLEQFNDNLKTIQESAGATENAYRTMANTTEFAHNKMENSMNNLKIAVGNNLNPMMEVFYNVTSGITDFVTGITEDLPILTSVFAAAAAGVGVLAVAVTGYTAVTKIATAAEAAHAAMINTTAGAIAWKTALIGGAVAALGVLAVSLASARSEEDEMTVSSIEMGEQLAELNDKYTQVSSAFGKTSVQAQELMGQINDMNQEYARCKMTVEEFYTQLDQTCEENQKLLESFNSVGQEALANKESAFLLIGRLKDLQKATDSSSASQAEMELIVRRLNQLYPQLGLGIDDVGDSLADLANKVNAFSGASIYDEAKAAEENLLNLRMEHEKLVKAEEEAHKIWQRRFKDYDEQFFLFAGINEMFNTGEAKLFYEAEEQWDKAKRSLRENEEGIAKCEEALGRLRDTQEGTTEEFVNANDAVEISIKSVQDCIEEISEAYYAAYEASLSSIEGQWKLWETAGEVAEASILDIGKAMASQIDYWKKYDETLELLHNRNIEGLDDLVASMADGSTESASYLHAMAESSDLDLMLMVAGYQELRDAQEETAVSMADLSTDFSTELSELQTVLEESVGKMNMSEEAYTAATETIQGYINGIKSMKWQVDDAMSWALKFSYNRQQELTPEPETPSLPEVTNPEVPINSPTWTVGPDPSWTLIDTDEQSHTSGGHAFAKGTTDSPSVYLAGEEGPELIISGGHDTVFPTSETDRIIASLMNREGDESRYTIPISADDYPEQEASRPITNESDRKSESYSYSKTEHSESINSTKTINLNINHTGNVQIDRNTDLETLWEDQKDNLKSAFMNILSDEIYEGGEGLYEY